jgi:putative phosphoesterase
MIICILSDTHNSRSVAKRAASQVATHAPEAVIHCGDLESPDMLEIFSGLPMHLVFGNCDWDTQGIRKKAEQLSFGEVGYSIELTLAGKKIFAHHGNNGTLLSQALASGEFDYIFHGHTHRKDDQQEGRTRIICPGALYRADSFTFSVLNLQTGEMMFEEVPG